MPFSRDDKEADLPDQATGDRHRRLVIEDVAHRIVVVEIPCRLDLERGPIEECAEADLANELAILRIPKGCHDACRWVPPLRDAPIVSKPIGMFGRIVVPEAGDRGDQFDTVGGQGIAAVEIVFGQGANHSVATEQERQRLDDCRLSAVVGPDKDGVRPEFDARLADAAKVLDPQLDNLHRFPSDAPQSLAGYMMGSIRRVSRRTFHEPRSRRGVSLARYSSSMLPGRDHANVRKQAAAPCPQVAHPEDSAV